MGNTVTHSDWGAQRERLSAYMDGELPAAERAALGVHLRDCAQCQRELAALRQTRALLRALPAPALPRDFRLPAQPAAVAAGPRRPPAWARPAQAIGMIAAMIGLAFLVATALPHLPHTLNAGMAGGAETSTSSHQPVYGPETGTVVPSPTASSTEFYSSLTATASADQYAGPGQRTPQANATGTPDNTLEHAPTVAPTSAPTWGAVGSSTGSNSGVTAERGSPTASAEPFPVVPVAGFTLLFGGVAAAAAGSLARRRARADEPDPRDAELEDW